MSLLFMIFIGNKQYHNMTFSGFSFGKPNLKGSIFAYWQKSFPQSSCTLSEFGMFQNRPSVQKSSAFPSTFCTVVLSKQPQMLFYYSISVSSRGKRVTSSIELH